MLTGFPPSHTHNSPPFRLWAWLSRAFPSAASPQPPRAPERVVIPHEPRAFSGRQESPVEEKAELGVAAEAELVPNDAAQVGDEAHLTRLQEQPAQPASRASRGRIVKKQPHPHRAQATVRGRRHLGKHERLRRTARDKINERGLAPEEEEFGGGALCRRCGRIVEACRPRDR